MFIEVTSKIQHLLANEKDRVFKNDFIPDGMACNAQFLRYDSIRNVWELEIRAQFASFKMELQYHQAQAIINGNEMFHYYKASIISHTVRDPSDMH